MSNILSLILESIFSPHLILGMPSLTDFKFTKHIFFNKMNS